MKIQYHAKLFLIGKKSGMFLNNTHTYSKGGIMVSYKTTVTGMIMTLLFCSIALFAKVPLDSLGEGTCVAWKPISADTVSDTSFGIGDTLYLPNGEISVNVPADQREEVTIPSVGTEVSIICGDGFANGKVTQVFRNPFDLPMETQYVFPLPHNGAVHGMDFRTSTGVFHADIQEKEEAKKQYEEAKKEGKQASLLLQSQDNIFIQKLCNILPHDSVEVTIYFSMSLIYDMGTFELAFPTVVGPRYDPAPLAKQRSNPLYVPPGTRSGSSLDFTILFITPYQIADLVSPNHDVTVTEQGIDQMTLPTVMLEMDRQLPEGSNTVLVQMNDKDVLPNRDIVLRFGRKSPHRDVSVLSYHDGNKGYFALQIYPDLLDTASKKPQNVDLVFVLDVSGSMGGIPLMKLKEIMNAMLDKATPGDRLSFLAFSNSTSNFNETPVAATPENIAAARQWISNLYASGGTQMLSGVRKGLSVPLEPGRTRIMTLITDGFIGGINDIYAEIENDPNETIAFTFGIGNSTNRELMDLAANAGEGIATMVLLNDDVKPIVDDFWTRIRIPQLKNISIDWGGEIPTALTRQSVGDLWYGQPVLLFGMYQQGGPRTIMLNADKDGEAVSESYDVNFVSDNRTMECVAQMWARQTIENLRNEQSALYNEQNKDKILEISLAFGVLCEYTAFIAVADSVVNENGELVSTETPAENPDGVDSSMAGSESWGPGSLDASEAISVSGTPKITIMPLSQNLMQIYLASFTPEVLAGKACIYDVKGRLIMEWSLAELAAANYRWTWNFTDRAGNPITRGFFVLVIRTPELVLNQPIAYK
ncbi:MAG: VWA domain-containing protein [Chitinivibrionales bacterium]|nr:VWA domain-containing protein [Chitinivibrionales bacterium]